MWKGAEIIHRVELEALAAVELIKAFLGGAAKPFDPGSVFPLALLQEAEAFAHDFAGIAETDRGNAGLDEAVEMFGQIDVPGGHAAASNQSHDIRVGNCCQRGS